jgi:hypothetical protein
MLMCISSASIAQTKTRDTIKVIELKSGFDT